MKISIITILDNVNIGTYLQAFALGKVLEELGHQPEYIDYSRPSRDNFFRFKSSFTKKAPWHWLGTWSDIYKRSRIIRNQRPFIQKYLSQKHYVGYKDVLRHPPIADVYLTGSDQVWNSEYNQGIDKTFYLDYAPSGSKLIAYAASFGMSDIPEKEKEEVRVLLERYEAISVRELQGKNILVGIGFNPNKISVVLDPTLLLDKEIWRKECVDNPEKSPYLLVYCVEKDRYDAINKASRYIATSKRLKVVGVTSNTHSRFSCDTLYKSASPSLFLSLFMGASFVIVSSFHGTAFSINFEKDFMSIMPARFNSRVDSFLNQMGLQNRKYYVGQKEMSHYLAPIDYSRVNEKLSLMRKSSLDFLRDNLNVDDRNQ